MSQRSLAHRMRQMSQRGSIGVRASQRSLATGGSTFGRASTAAGPLSARRVSVGTTALPGTASVPFGDLSDSEDDELDELLDESIPEDAFRVEQDGVLQPDDYADEFALTAPPADLRTIIIPNLPEEVLAEDVHLAMERTIGPKVYMVRMHEDKKSTRNVRTTTHGLTAGSMQMITRTGQSIETRQMAYVLVEGEDAQILAQHRAVFIRGEQVTVLKTALAPDVLEDEERIEKAKRRTDRIVEKEKKLLLRTAEEEHLYGDNPLQLESTAARRLLAVPGTHFAARDGARTVKDAASIDAERKMKAMERERKRQAEREQAQKEYEDALIYEGREAAKAVFDRFMKRGGDDEERAQLTRAYVTVPSAALEGEPQELWAELFEAVQDNDPVRLEALLMEFRARFGERLASRRAGAEDAQALTAMGKAAARATSPTSGALAILHGVQDPVARALQYTTKGASDASLLHWAAMHGALDVIPLILREGLLIEARDKHGNTALHYAIMNDELEAAALLLARGADVNARGTGGAGALHFAAAKGYGELIKDLLERGAVLDQRDDMGLTAVSVAMDNGHDEVVQVLTRRFRRVQAERARHAREVAENWMYDDERDVI